MIIQLQKLILILVRITAFIVLCPGFSFRSLPNIMKVAISFSLTMLVYFMTPEMQVTGSIPLFIILTVKEAIFGLAIGYISQLVFTAVEIAGRFIDFQVGFSMGTVYDPNTGSNISNYGKLYYWLTVCVFFLLNLHHRLIETMIQSFNYIPITTVDLKNLSIAGMIKLFGQVFEIGFNLAAPLIIVILLTDIILGIISRTIPQINVLLLGMPLKILVSMVIILAVFSSLLKSIANTLGMIPGYLNEFFQLFT